MMVNKQIKAFSINLNTRHVNGMTPFNLAVQSGKLLIIRERTYVWLLDRVARLLPYKVIVS